MFKASEGGVGGVGGVFLARGDYAEEPGLVECGLDGAAAVLFLLLLQGGEDGGEEGGDGLFGGGEGEGGVYSVAPELVAHTADGGGGGGVRDAGELEVEGADGEVGGAEGGREEGGDDVGWVVILSVGKVSGLG